MLAALHGDEDDASNGGDIITGGRYILSKVGPATKQGPWKAILKNKNNESFLFLLYKHLSDFYYAMRSVADVAAVAATDADVAAVAATATDTNIFPPINYYYLFKNYEKKI